MSQINYIINETMNTRDFLETLYGGLEGKFIYLWTMPDKITYWFHSDDIQGMADKALQLNREGKSVYFGLGASDKRKQPTERLTAAEVTAIPAVWIDIDIAGTGHKSDRLPATLDEAMTIVNSLPLQPSMLVASGGGLHLYYIFKEPWELNTPEDRAQAAWLVLGIQTMLKQKNPQYEIDSTHDLSRVLRPVGTTNSKYNLPVQIIECSNYRYSFDDLDQYTAEPTIKQIGGTVTGFERRPTDRPAGTIVNNCKFIQHCRDNASTLSYPEWLAMLTNIGRASDGVDVAHTLSQPYGKYSITETNKKLFQALEMMNPTSCNYIQSVYKFNCPGECGVKNPAGWSLDASKGKALEVQEALAIIQSVAITPEAIFTPVVLGACAVLDAQNSLEFPIFKAKIKNKINLNDLHSAIKKNKVASKKTEERYWFDDEGNFIPPPLAEKIINDNDILYDRQDLFFYDEGVYQGNGRATTKKIVLEILGDKYRDTRGTEVTRFIETKLYQSEPVMDRRPDILNLINGVIDISDWCKTGVLTLQPHSHEYLSSIRVPVVYDANADCPAIKKFISEVLPADCQDLIYEIIGHLLFPDCRFEKAFMLTGSGANGKSKLLEMISHFIGFKNSSSVSLQDLSDNRFRSAELTGKLINICPDISSKLIEESAVFKALVTGDWITVERKGQNPFQIKNTARLLFSANEIPRSRDNTYSFFRRWIVLNFGASFPLGDPRRDENLLQKLTTPEEMSGLLNIALEGYARLCTNRKFSESESTQKAIEKYQIENDTVKQFLLECCNLVSSAWIEKDSIFRKYTSWCITDNLKPLGRIKFNRKLQELCPGIYEDTNGVKKCRGIGVADTFSPDY